MGVGYPDFFSYDIVKEYSVQHDYGGFVYGYSGTQVESIISLTGEGKLTRLYIDTQLDDPDIRLRVYIVIDGKNVEISESDEHGINSFFTPEYDFLRWTYRDNYNQRFVCELQKDIIFFESLDIKIQMVTNSTAYIICRYNYSEPNPNLIYVPI